MKIIACQRAFLWLAVDKFPLVLMLEETKQLTEPRLVELGLGLSLAISRPWKFPDQ
jgi:hypothetical protein